ncbi:hypothetical protein [Thermogemmatispora sp.]|uniref:hypothetical protein n=1 Tax=Thermogemmatispora sp. TaxID=1968838 RepID=UPI001DCDE88D|nr:hypothetical protein [Thermogemmatispora sp.]MBX5450239.1 hypothetical protein [Thermogemmatispora sp.]
MKKSTTRILCLISLALWIIGGLMLLVPLFSILANPQATAGEASLLIVLSPVLLIPAAILYLIAWVGALIRATQLGRWGWFAVIFFFALIGLLIYSFVGPETPLPTEPPL